jgi:nucleoside-diphosphate-sugar epimerase
MAIASSLRIFLGLCCISGADSLASVNIPLKSPELLILGMGKVGLEVARQTAALTTPAGHHFRSVSGTVRNSDNGPHDDIDDRIQRIPCELPTILPRLASTTHVLVTIPAGAVVGGESQLDAVFDAVCQGLPTGCWLGLISTTGVYGNYDGAWVTEESECRPHDDTSTARQFVEYEAAWCERAVKNGHHLSIFRCGGIYGPGRSAMHTIFQKGMPAAPTPTNSDKPPVMDLTNRIHEHDLAAAVVASMLLLPVEKEDPKMPACEIYNLADDQPESRRIVLEYASDLLQSINVSVETRSAVVAATGGTAIFTPKSGRSVRRRTDHKRVSNQKMRDVLLPFGLQYPTYKEGLEAILIDPTSPWQQPNTIKE